MHRYIRFRHRYIFTRHNRLRLRYVASTVFILSFFLLSIFGSSPSSVAHVPEIAALEHDEEFYLEEEEVVISLADADIVPLVEPSHLAENLEEKISPLLSPVLEEHGDFIIQMTEFVPSAETKPFEADRVLKIGPGQTVAGVLQDAGLNGAEVYRIVKEMSTEYDPRSVKAGQVLAVSFEQNPDDGISLGSLNMKLGSAQELVITKDDHERFSAEINEKEIVLRQRAVKADIESSLYGSAARAGIPASIVAEMIRIYSYEVDFQRDLRRGDRVELLYEVYETEDGDFARYGNILHANLMVKGQEIPVYRFEKPDGQHDYYHKNGLNLRRTLMQTPIDGARISSGYGMRRHPVLGYNKMHKGIDFAAPRGTPIFAAGDGVIDKIGRNGGYGNYIRIKHNGTLQTAYAHLHRFAKRMKKGTRVKQGQVIGYVGSTGRSTGPHLHFEVIKNGKQTNPKNIKSSAREKLAGKNLRAFKTYIRSLESKYSALLKGFKVAQSDTPQ